MQDDTPKPRASRAKSRKPTTPPRVRCRLKTVDDVKVELARLYREGKAKKRDVGDVSKLANVLSILARMIEGADIEARIAALEKAAQKGSTP